MAVSDEMADVCRKLAQKEMVSATDGNVSVRTGRGTFLITRSSVHKGDVTPKDIIEVDSEANVLKASDESFRPSTESKMHLFIYGERPEINAVVHAHPVYATAFAVAGEPIDKPVLPEVIVMLGKVPLAPYATPSTDEVPESIRPFVKNHNALLLGNHGAVTYGKTLNEAYYAMEKLEHAARILYHARMLGGVKTLNPGQLAKLKEVSYKSYGIHVNWDTL